jgi:hypothetical protein
MAVPRTRHSGNVLARYGVYVQVIPPGQVIGEQFHQAANRARKPAYGRVLTLLERIHAVHFARLDGRYVLTGRTMASLTRSNAYGAIRRGARGGPELRFGSRVWYAHFLTKSPHDPAFGQLRKEPPGEGLSAVLVMPKGTKKKVAKILGDYIMEPFVR